MQNLNSTYARWYNKEHDRCGPVFQGRFGSFLIEKDDYLLAAARYIVLNPVEAGIVGGAASYPWSSFREMMGTRKCPEFLDVSTISECFSPNQAVARRQFRSFVERGLEEEDPDYLERGPVCGGDEFMKAVEEQVMTSGKACMKDISRKERFFNRPALVEMFSKPADKHIREIRNLKIREAFQDYGYNQREIGDFLGLHCSTVSNIIRSLENQIGNNW